MIFFSLFTFCLTKSDFISNSIQSLKGNITANFGSLKISHLENYFQIPTYSQKINLNLNNIYAHNSFAHFISSTSFFSKSSIKIQKSKFKNYKTSPIMLSREETTLSNGDYTFTFGSTAYLKGDTSLDVQYCRFINCTALGDIEQGQGFAPANCGGAIYGDGSSFITLSSTYFENCQANSKGGAVFAKNISQPLTIVNCFFTRDQSRDGAAIYIEDCHARISNCNFDNTLFIPPENSASKIASTICFFALEYQLTVLFSAFTGSGFISASNASYAEILVIHELTDTRTVPVSLRYLCILQGQPQYPIIENEHIAILIYSTSVTHDISNINIDMNEEIYEYMIYQNTNSYQTNKLTTANSDCFTIYMTPRPTDIPVPSPEITPETTPLTTPFTTPLTTPYTTPLSTPFTTPLTTPYTTPLTTPSRSVISSSFSSSFVEEGEESSGLTNSEKIIVSVVIIGVLLLLILILLIVLFATKDRRKAFSGEDDNDEELHYPEIETELR